MGKQRAFWNFPSQADGDWLGHDGFFPRHSFLVSFPYSGRGDGGNLCL